VLVIEPKGAHLSEGRDNREKVSGGEPWVARIKGRWRSAMMK
jgi:hypothetical protein